MYFYLKFKGIEIIMLYIWYLINVDFKFELQKVKVCFYVFFVLIVDFNQKKD